MVGARDEVGEGVGLGLELAVVVPRPAQLGAAADVRDGEDPAAVEQREPQHGEPGVARDAVGAVRVEQAGRGAVGRHVVAVHDGDRDAGAVGRRGPLAPLAVLRQVDVAAHVLLLEQGEGARADVVVLDGAGSDE